MNRIELEAILNDTLSPQLIKDYCPNGLQIQGTDSINKIVTGVTACQQLIDKAIELNADAVLVHHGYFWKNEPYEITGMKYQRIKSFIDNNLNLFAYHLPLDIHKELGNNAQLAKLLSITNIEPLELGNPLSVSVKGRLSSPMTASELQQKISGSLKRECLHLGHNGSDSIETVAWCTGGGQGYVELAASQKIDAFITGEVSEQTTHVAREMGIHFYAAGHHATERYGVKALGEHLQANYGLDVTFVDIDNPV